MGWPSLLILLLRSRFEKIEDDRFLTSNGCGGVPNNLERELYQRKLSNTLIVIVTQKTRTGEYSESLEARRDQPVRAFQILTTVVTVHFHFELADKQVRRDDLEAGCHAGLNAPTNFQVFEPLS